MSQDMTPFMRRANGRDDCTCNVADHSADPREHDPLCAFPLLSWGAAEIERLTLENWQLKGALGYEVPGDIPEGDFKCGLCDARRRTYEGHWPPEAE
jgi:hypothetical protein